jgi:pseudaminic acid synthase
VAWRESGLVTPRIAKYNKLEPPSRQLQSMTIDSFNSIPATPTIALGERRIGAGQPVYVVAELSANHSGSLETARELVRAAKAAGADAVKLQTYTADTLTIRSDRPEFRISGGTLWDGRTLYDLYQEAATPWEWHADLFAEARRLGMDCFSTPFDTSAVDFLEALNPPAHKIASFELVDLALLRKVAATRRPVILSTGMATLEEISEAVTTLRDTGCRELVLLKCTSSYPAPVEETNLRTIPDLASRFDCPVGLSDHTPGIACPVVAVSLGASLIEKHFTLSRQTPGPDSAFSLEPTEFAEMIGAIRVAEAALGRVHYGLSPAETKSRVFRRSLFAVADIAAGERFTEQNVRSIRPGHGLPPKELPKIVGKRAARAISRGEPLSWDCVNE